MMIRGTTPTIQIELPHAFDIESCYITIRQRRNNVVEKSLNDGIVVRKNIIETTLSQEDTLKLKEGDVEIQLRFRTANGEAFATDVNDCVEIGEILKEGVI